MPVIDYLDPTTEPSPSYPNQPDIPPLNPPDISPDSESTMVHTSVGERRYVRIDFVSVSDHSQWTSQWLITRFSHMSRLTSIRSSGKGAAQPVTSLHAPQPTKTSSVHSITSIECTQRRTDSSSGCLGPRDSSQRPWQGTTVLNGDDNVVIEPQRLEVPPRDDDEELSPRGSTFATEAGHKTLVKEKPLKPKPAEGDKESTQSKPSLKTR